MADEYMILESKMNNLSLNELGELDPDYTTPIVNYIMNFKNNLNKADISDLKEVAGILSRRITNNQLGKLKMPIGMYYCTYTRRFVAERLIRGKKYYLKSSKDADVVIKAASDFAKKHKLKVYG